MAYDKTNDLIPREKGEGVTQFTNGILRFDGRFSFCYVVDGQEGTNDDGKKTMAWPTQLYIPKDKGADALKFAVRRVNELLVDNKVAKLAPERKFFRDGNKAKNQNTGEPIPEAQGNWIVSARSSAPVLLYGPRTDPATGKPEVIAPSPAAKALFYSGAWGSILVRPWFQDGKKNPKNGLRANAELVAIQFKRHGDPFGMGRIGADKAAGGFDSDDTGGWAEGDDGLGGGESDDGL